MKTGTITAARFRESIGRFDANYHLSEGQKALELMKYCPFKVETVGNNSNGIFHAGRFKRIFVSDPKMGTPLWGVTAILQTSPNDTKLLSNKHSTNLPQLLVKEGWTLIACSGSGLIGTAAFTNANFLGRALSQDVIRVVPDETKILPGFLYAFFASSYGYNIIQTGIYGSAIPHIEPYHIESIPIPIFPSPLQHRIHDLVTEAARLRVEANEALRDAQIHLQQNLFGMKTLNLKAELSGVVNSKEIFQTKRLNPEVMMGAWAKEFKRLRDSGISYEALGHLVNKVRRPGIFKRVYVKPESGFPYITGSDCFSINPFKSCDYISKKRTPFLDELALREHEILMTCAGSVGNVKIITKEFEEKQALGSQDIIRINCGKKLPVGYVFAYLSLPVVKSYIVAHRYGSVIDRIEPFHVEGIPVFLAKKEIIEQVHYCIMDYSNKLYLAFKSEEEAISLTENEISSWRK